MCLSPVQDHEFLCMWSMDISVSLVSSLHCMAPGTYLIRMDEWMDIWMDGQMDGWTDGWVALLLFGCLRLDKKLFRFSVGVTKNLNEIFGQPNISTLIQSHRKIFKNNIYPIFKDFQVLSSP